MKIRMLCALGLTAALFAGAGFAAGRCLPVSEAIPHEAPVAASSDFEGQNAIDRFRAERQSLRQMQLSQLAEIIHGDDPDLAAAARQKQLELMEWSEQELTLEGTLSLRGYRDVLVTVHTDSVNVMVRAEAVSRSEAAVILEAVTRETGISGGNVKIIPIN